MQEIPRSLVIVRPKQPFLDWLNGLPDAENPIIASEIKRDPSAFLAPDFETAQEARVFIKANYEAMFEIELHSWHTDYEAWPHDLDYETFCEWFEVEMVSAVYDFVEHRTLNN